MTTVSNIGMDVTHMEKYFLGTYTHRISQGIYSFEFDPTTGTAANLTLVHKAENPFYLALGPDNLLYCINNDSHLDTPGGLMALDQNDLTHVAYTTYDAAVSGTYLAFNAPDNLVYLANYDINELSLYSVKNGEFELKDRVHNAGTTGPKKEQADGAHPHFINQTPDGRLVVCDLGLDQIFTYSISSDLRFQLVASLTLPAGFGPRHIRFNRNQNIAYAVGELSSEIASLKYDPKTGSFQIINITPTIPANWTAHNGAAAIRISADNRYLYVSNRGYNSIAVFEIQDTGNLNLIQNVDSAGDFPWDLNFSNDENFILVANQRSDNLSVFVRDEDTGLLTLINNDFSMPEPLAIVATR